MQSITYFTNMNGFRTQDAVLEPKMLTLLGTKKWVVGIKLAFGRGRVRKSFFGGDVGNENLGCGVLG